MKKKHKKIAYDLFAEFHPLVSVALISAFCFISAQIGTTVSYLSDVELSTANALEAASLDFTVSADGSIDAYIGIEDAGGNTVIPVLNPVQGTLPIEYKI